ncbi:hypothetical protein N7488_012347 [Penicillium malachiteum]|nr:hypothetical protein N7488_012347 [Penicillium malachiteum]
MGKSTIVLTIVKSLSEEKTLGASFIFSKQHGDLSHARLFVTTIASQLARNIPNLRNYIERAIEENPKILGDWLGQQWKHLVWEPLAQLEVTKLESDSNASSAPQ